MEEQTFFILMKLHVLASAAHMLNLMKFHFQLFFMLSCFCCCIIEIQSRDFVACSGSFVVLSFIFSSVTHFELVFGYGVRYVKFHWFLHCYRNISSLYI